MEIQRGAGALVEVDLRMVTVRRTWNEGEGGLVVSLPNTGGVLATPGHYLHLTYDEAIDLVARLQAGLMRAMADRVQFLERRDEA